MNDLGVMYAKGEVVAENKSEAFRWYRKAAEKGNATAMSNLGAMYRKGEGVAEDRAESVRWYRKAAENGNVSAMNSLGIAYEHGRGVRKSTIEARKWYRKAIAAGSQNAEDNLRSMESKHGTRVRSRRAATSDAEAAAAVVMSVALIYAALSDDEPVRGSLKEGGICATCEGNGTVFGEYKEHCSYCSGTGWVGDFACSVCGGHALFTGGGGKVTRWGWIKCKGCRGQGRR